MKLSEALDELLIATRAFGRSDRTVGDYSQKGGCLVDFLEDKEIEQVTLADLRRFVNDLMQRTSRFEDHPNREPQQGGLSAASISGYVRVVKRLFSFLVEEELLAQNPAKRLMVPKVPRKAPKAISKSDFLLLLDSIDAETVVGKRDRALILMLRDSGCRVGGLVRMDVQDVDMEQSEVILREKGAKIRTGFFSGTTKCALQAWLDVRPDNKGNRIWVNLGTRGGEHLTEQGVSEVLKRLKRKSSVKGPVNPHSLRHGYARDFLQGGGDLASLADIMGHSNVEVTWAFYAVFSTAELKRTHQRYSPVAQLERAGAI